MGRDYITAVTHNRYLTYGGTDKLLVDVIYISIRVLHNYEDIFLPKVLHRGLYILWEGTLNYTGRLGTWSTWVYISVRNYVHVGNNNAFYMYWWYLSKIESYVVIQLRIPLLC
jgi:hypothetical protein